MDPVDPDPDSDADATLVEGKAAYSRERKHRARYYSLSAGEGAREHSTRLVSTASHPLF